MSWIVLNMILEIKKNMLVNKFTSSSKNKTTDSFELAKHFRGGEKFDKQYDNETKEGYTTVIKSLDHIIKQNNSVGDILKLS